MRLVFFEPYLSIHRTLQTGNGMSAAPVTTHAPLDEWNAFLYRVPTETATDRPSSDSSTPLTGNTLAVKDNIAVSGMPLSCASKLLDGFLSPYSATAVQRLQNAGMIVIGKTNLDEFAMGSSNEYSAYGPVRNPHDPAFVPGGSSGGSAAAVAAGLCDAALGSDTGGSVRQPAAFCGLVGFKPSYGRVSRYGLTAFASSLDQIGVLARDVRTAAEIGRTMAGTDPYDATTASDTPGTPWDPGDNPSIPSNRIGYAASYAEGLTDPIARRALENSVDHLRDAGASVIDVELPSTDEILPIYTILSAAEAFSNLARFDGGRYGRRIGGASWWESLAETRRDGFGAEVKRRILTGAFVLREGYGSRIYNAALQARDRLRAFYDRLFSQIDALLMPTTPGPAFRLGSIHDPLEMYRWDRYTVHANLAGLPALHVPMPSEGLPVGVQLLGPAMQEPRLLRIAAVLEAMGGAR
ncbi:Asp-tRNA(Asn)/Glu-tRNA(Gln) amidotransferase subunit GatA [bacterium]|nr:Asp-tRNA(Asn)/Glu-tRNA(Gln) amidotransferase subunit GatA [bacterium]